MACKGGKGGKKGKGGRKGKEVERGDIIGIDSQTSGLRY